MLSSSDIAIQDFDYNLPEDRIAKYPLKQRDQSKLLLYNKGRISHTVFQELPGLLDQEDFIIFNNTKVIQARTRFQKATGSVIEIFCLEPVDPPQYERSFQANASVSWKCMIGNAKKWKSGPLKQELIFGDKTVQLSAVKQMQSGKEWIIRFSWSPGNLSFSEILEKTGKTPIPPYLNREAEHSDKFTYQTVYSLHKGSVAAPTAGLHFTNTTLQSIKNQGIKSLELTLHVGAGTFRPVIANQVSDHSMHTEHIYFSLNDIEMIRDHTGNILTVGTTSTRTLETIYWLGCKITKQQGLKPDKLNLGQWEAYDLDPLNRNESLENLWCYLSRNNLNTFETTTQLMIIPGYKYRMTDKMITNYHLPKSTLLLLVGAFIGNDWREVYQYAMENDFRFLSYGDSSLLIP